jgi:hypothetical protein
LVHATEVDELLPVKPLDGADGWFTISSSVFLLKYVTSRLSRLNSSVSNPTSISLPRSGLRFRVPYEFGVTALAPPGPGQGEIRPQGRVRVGLTAGFAVAPTRA